LKWLLPLWVLQVHRLPRFLFTNCEAGTSSHLLSATSSTSSMSEQVGTIAGCVASCKQLIPLGISYSRESLTSVKVRDSCPQTPQGENHKIADAQLPPSCVFADSRCLLGGATQMDCGMELLVLRTYQRASLHGQHRGACPVRNFLFNPHTAFQYKQQIATQRAVLRRGIFANASSVLVREANKQ